MKCIRTSKLNKIPQLVALSLILATKALCTVTITARAWYLKDENEIRMPTTGLVLLVASTSDDAFTPPSPNAFVSGDDIEIARWDLFATGIDGRLFDIAPNLTLGGGWNSGDPLQLYWFPSLSKAATAPGHGIHYGQYRTDAIPAPDSSAPWVTPSDGATVTLIFRTQEASGSSPDVLGNASFVVGGVTAPVILSLTIANATNAVITWSASSNFTYRVQHQPALGAAWSNLVPDITATNSAASAMDNFDGHARRFYRIQLVQ